MITKQADCIIIGGGLAGWMAAFQCANAGLSVCLLRDGQGASPWVHGFNVPVLAEDSPEAFREDTLLSGQGLSTPALADALCYDARDMLSFLEELGLRFNRSGDDYQTLKPLGASHPRVVSIGNETGVEVLRALQNRLADRVEVVDDARALKLTVSGGRVTGVMAYLRARREFRFFSASAVVLACGGYCGIFPVTTSKRDSGGDGMAMAFEAGAQLCDMEFIQFEPSAAVWPPELIGTSMITTLFYEGAVLRNSRNERFMLRYGPEGERVGKDVMSRRIAEEIAGGNGTEHQGVLFDATGVDRERLERDYAMYVERYRRVGIELADQPIELAPAPHTSLGGVCVDDQCRTCLEGLFVCGEAMGGLHGANRIGGNAGLETLVFGRRAGRSAALYAQRQPRASVSAAPDEPVFGNEDPTAQLEALRASMRQTLRHAMGPLRNEGDLTEALSLLRKALAQTDALSGRNAEEAFACLRLHNDLIAALLSVTAALKRTGSLGCHVRTDEPDEAPAQPYRLCLQRDGAGEIRVRRTPV